MRTGFRAPVLAGMVLLLGSIWACSESGSAASPAAGLGWDPAALDGGARVLWRVDVAAGHSAVAVGGRRLITVGSRHPGRSSRETFDVVTCLDLDSGKVVWEHRYRCRPAPFPGPRATPAVAGELVYTLSWEGHLHCLSINDGTVVWSRNIVSDGFAKAGHWGLCGSPVVEGDLLIVTAGRSGLAVNRITGQVVWSSEASETSLPSPVLLDWGARRLAVVPGGSQLHGVDVPSGEILWSVPNDDGYYLAATVVGNQLVVPARSDLTAYDLESSPPEATLQASGAGFSEYQNYVVHEGHVYGFSRDMLQCVELASGQRRWKERLGPHGSLAVADGQLIIITGDGTLVIAAASPAGYRPVSSAKVIEIGPNSGIAPPKQHWCWTEPLKVRDRIVVRSNHGQLVCVDVAASSA